MDLILFFYLLQVVTAQLVRLNLILRQEENSDINEIWTSFRENYKIMQSDSWWKQYPSKLSYKSSLANFPFLKAYKNFIVFSVYGNFGKFYKNLYKFVQKVNNVRTFQ